MTTEFISATKDQVSKPLPLEEHDYKDSFNPKGFRIWIGNVDPALNEFSLLQLLKQFGSIKELDYLFYKSGPNEGKSKGFHFATFGTKIEAERAISSLNGKQVFSKTLQVRWAHQEHTVEKKVAINVNLKSDVVKQPTLLSDNSIHKTSNHSVIHSIERKLKEMEEDRSISTSSSGNLHPLLMQSKANQAAEEARKRMHPYRKSYSKRR